MCVYIYIYILDCMYRSQHYKIYALYFIYPTKVGTIKFRGYLLESGPRAQLS